MFKRVHIDCSSTRLVQRSGTICAILEESIMGKTPGKYFFKFGPVVQQELSFKQKFLDGQMLDLRQNTRAHIEPLAQVS